MAPDPGSVLVVHNRYRQAGGEDAVVAAETALLAANGHRVETFVVDNADLPDPSGVVGRARLAAETIWSARSAREVAAAARDVGADVVHVHNFLPQLSPSVHGAARDTGAAVVQTLHNYRLVCPAATLLRDGRVCEDCRPMPIALPAVVHACYRGSRAETAVVTAMLAVHRLRRTWVRDVDAFIALTPSAARLLVSGGLPAARLHVKANFVDVPAPPDDGPRDGFLFVGRLSVEKGIAPLLAGWRRGRPGVDPDRSSAMARHGPRSRRPAAVDPTIRLLGQVDRSVVVDEMRRAAALVMPSIWYEGMPMTLVEAFANGLPVIASDLGAMADMVAEGRTGRRFPAGDAGALAGALRDAAADPTAWPWRAERRAPSTSSATAVPSTTRACSTSTAGPSPTASRAPTAPRPAPRVAGRRTGVVRRCAGPSAHVRWSRCPMAPPVPAGDTLAGGPVSVCGGSRHCTDRRHELAHPSRGGAAKPRGSSRSAGLPNGATSMFWDGSRWVDEAPAAVTTNPTPPRRQASQPDWLATGIMALAVVALVVPMFGASARRCRRRLEAVAQGPGHESFATGHPGATTRSQVRGSLVPRRPRRLPR